MKRSNVAEITFADPHFTHGLGFGHNLVLVHFGHAISVEKSGMGEGIKNKMHVVGRHLPVFILERGFKDGAPLVRGGEIVQDGDGVILDAEALHRHIGGQPFVRRDGGGKGLAVAILALLRVP